MPIYEYRCEACQEVVELIQKVDAPPPESCSKCGDGPMKKLISLSAFHLKGSGWYSDHYGLKDKPDKNDTGGGAAATSAATSTETNSAENKSEGGSASSSESASESKSESKSESSSEKKPEKKAESKASGSSDSGTAAA